MKTGDAAKELFLGGYNCSQAVFCAFGKEHGFDETSGKKLACCFGGGLGRQREVCGAVSAMCMVLSLKYAPEDPADHAQKAAFYARVQELCRRFKQENGSIICRELLGLVPPAQPQPCAAQGAVNGDPFSPVPEPRNAAYYAHRACADKVKSAAEILEQYLAEQAQ